MPTNGWRSRSRSVSASVSKNRAVLSRGVYGCFFLLCVSGVVRAESNALIRAIKDGNDAALHVLVTPQTDVNVVQADGATALHWAVHMNRPDVVQLLITARAKVNAATDLGVTPLSIACTNGSAELVGALLKAGANPHAILSTGETPLMTCARSGSADAVGRLLAHDAELDAKEQWRGQTALMWAVSENHQAVVRVLLEHGADVNGRSNSGFTPLMFAAREGALDMARQLVTAGARVNDTASDGSSPLLLAIVRGHSPLAEFMLAKGADANKTDAGYTALHWAAGSWETTLTGIYGIRAVDSEWSELGGIEQHERPALVRALLAHGANPNARITKQPPRFGFTVFGLRVVGATPFFLAAMAGDVTVMKILLEAGADPSLGTNENTTPMMVAAGLGRAVGESRVTEVSALDAVKLVYQFGTDVNAANQAGDTALHGASSTGSDSIVSFLVDNGASVNVANKRGRTPLAVAKGAGAIGYERTADLLRRLGAKEELDLRQDTGPSR